MPTASPAARAVGPTQPHPRFRGRTGLGEYGEVLAALDRNRVRDETLVIFTSDNGSYMYRLDDAEPGHLDVPSVQGYHMGRHRSNAGWQGTKADVWEGGHRVPFVVRWPEVAEAGSEPAAPSSIPTSTRRWPMSWEPRRARRGRGQRVAAAGTARRAGGAGDPRCPPSSGGMFAILHGLWKLMLGNGSGGRQTPRGEPLARPYQLCRATPPRHTTSRPGTPRSCSDWRQRSSVSATTAGACRGPTDRTPALPWAGNRGRHRHANPERRNAGGRTDAGSAKNPFGGARREDLRLRDVCPLGGSVIDCPRAVSHILPRSVYWDRPSRLRAWLLVQCQNGYRRVVRPIEDPYGKQAESPPGTSPAAGLW